MSDAARPARRWVWFLPLVVFAGLVVLFLFRLFAGDPSKLPSALIGQPAPTLTLQPVEGLMHEGRPMPGFGPADLATGKPVLVNVFASWCAPCHQEHPFLMDLAKAGRIGMIGLNYKDKPENARRFLGRLGNPYARVGADPDGRNAIEWGVYGVPETFLVDGRGIIVFKHVGPLTPEIIRDRLEPAIKAAGG
jgi:cytochrome c biogenesis protein CcmG/thiol:disulfide interchange protein DsbE